MKKLQQDVQECVERVAQAVNEAEWSDPAFYAAWLSQTYYYVCYTTRFVAFAAGHCRLDQEKLFASLAHGIHEERGHELLALRDLQRLGRSIDEFPECPETSAFYQTLFRNISVHGAEAIMGYSMPLEGVAATGIPRVIEAVTRRYGREGSTFLTTHCELDQDHYKVALASLDDLDEHGQEIVRKHLHLSTALYLGILAGAKRLAKQVPARKKAA